MDLDQFQQLPQAPFPAPPPFWRHFTAENAQRIRAIDNETAIPFNLNYLRAPSPPAVDAESYIVFSAPQKLDPAPALPPPEILLFNPNLPSFSHAKALRHLTRSLLLNFLELTTVLGNNPIQYEEKMQDIERLMLNVHFVINLYRPHQAREGVKEILQTRLDDGRREIVQCDEKRQKIDEYLKDIERQKNTRASGNDSADGRGDKIEDNEKLWNLIRSIDDD